MDQVRIRIRENGPYVVEGPFELVDAAGNAIERPARPNVALCRCGASVTKPFCDGTHSAIGFIGAQRAVDETSS
jgi:CDGSH-type Zn-finger protein